jgi:hypothetical protein
MLVHFFTAAFREAQLKKHSTHPTPKNNGKLFDGFYQPREQIVICHIPPRQRKVLQGKQN